MAPQQEIVITGVGVVSPIGTGKQAFAAGLAEGRSAIRWLRWFEDSELAVPVGAEVADFDPKAYVRPRKSLKVMSRDIQFAFAAADLACADARVDDQQTDPERLGIVFGSDMIPCDLHEMEAAYRGCMVDGTFDFNRWGETAMAEMFPLWILKYLPNMPACHIGIAQDARGPNNSLTHGDVSSLSAVAEAMRVIERGHADVMIAGGAGSRVHPGVLCRAGAFDLARRNEDPVTACRPFDARRHGMVLGEGAGAFILESRRHAEARGAKILARILGYAATFEPARNGQPLQGTGIRKAITLALKNARLTPGDVGHVNANGLSTILDDQIEAQAIRATLGDVPVTAPKSFFGHLGAGTGAVEMAVSVLAFEHGFVPPTLNYEYPDPLCPIHVIRCQPMHLGKPAAVVLNHAQFGQAIAVILGAAQ